MARSSNDILFKFVGDTKSLDRATGKASKSMKKTQTSSAKLTKAMGALGAALGAREVLAFAGDAVQMAIAAEEIDSKFQAVFGSSEAFRKSLEEWGDVAGVTKTRGEELASTFGNLAIAQGISEEDTKALTLEVATLAGDMASFNDADPEQVFFDLNQALLTTEREGLKKYGIAISETEVKTLAASIATADGRDEVTKADRAYAAYELAVKQAGKAIGDLDKTSESTANVQRQLRASLEEMQEEIGRRLLPAYEDMLRLAVDLSPALVLVADAAGFLTQSLEPLQAVMAAVSGESFNALEALNNYAEVILKTNLATAPLAFAITAVTSGFQAEAKAGAKAAEAVSKVTVEQLEARGAYVNYARGMIDAANATGQLERKAFDADRIIKIFTGDLFAGARAAQAFRRSSGETIGSLFAGGSGSGQTQLAHGGTLNAGESAVVGELGPEVITAGQSMRVHPNGTGDGGGTVINITVNALDPDAAAVAVADALRSYEDRFGPL